MLTDQPLERCFDVYELAVGELGSLGNVAFVNHEYAILLTRDELENGVVDLFRHRSTRSVVGVALVSQVHGLLDCLACTLYLLAHGVSSSPCCVGAGVIRPTYIP